jgi:hypothetical protein
MWRRCQGSGPESLLPFELLVFVHVINSQFSNLHSLSSRSVQLLGMETEGERHRAMQNETQFLGACMAMFR